jgi:hypothetical protein
LPRATSPRYHRFSRESTTVAAATELRLPAAAPRPGSASAVTLTAANAATRSCPTSGSPDHPLPATVAQEGDAVAAPHFTRQGRRPPHHHGATSRARPRHHGAAPPTEGHEVPHEEAAPRSGWKTVADPRTPPETAAAATGAPVVDPTVGGSIRTRGRRSAPPRWHRRKVVDAALGTPTTARHRSSPGEAGSAASSPSRSRPVGSCCSAPPPRRGGAAERMTPPLPSLGPRRQGGKVEGVGDSPGGVWSPPKSP